MLTVRDIAVRGLGQILVEVVFCILRLSRFFVFAFEQNV